SFLHPPPPAGGRGAALPLLPGRRGGHRRGDLQLPVHGGDDPREKGATGGGPAGGTGGERVAKGKDSGPLIQGRRDVGFMPVGRGAPPGETARCFPGECAGTCPTPAPPTFGTSRCRSGKPLPAAGNRP